MASRRPSSSGRQPSTASFADHIGELRTRFAWVALVFVVASALAYQVRDQLVDIVLAPAGQLKLVYLTPAGGFSFIFQITMYVGMLATAPVGIYQLYRFVAPALPRRSSRTGIFVALAASLLMLAGACFGYFVAIPGALHFLTTFAGDYVSANLTADSYLGFIVGYVLGLGLLFELPLLLLLWNLIAPIRPGGLLASQRYVVVGAFIAAALITPTPDVMNQCMVALPIIGIYQLGVVAVFVINRRKRRVIQPQPVQHHRRALVPQPIAPTPTPHVRLPAAQVQGEAGSSSATRPWVVDIAPRRRPPRQRRIVVPKRSELRLPVETARSKERQRATGTSSAIPRNIDGFEFVQS